MFVTSAYAQTINHAAGATGTSDLLLQMLPLLAIVLIFYVLMFRPMEQQRKRQEVTLAGLKKGDQVVTAGGVIGTVQTVNDDELSLEIADGVRVRVVRSTIAGLHGAAEPVSRKLGKFPGKAG